MIWIIGEYADRIDNADELLETFLETFPEVGCTASQHTCDASSTTKLVCEWSAMLEVLRQKW
jgi:hypothetical protein